ncbi:MAG: hypothetical protein HKN42_11355 [Granulosicoccus sp.]|nr:hypothetical protein [Granulosicoccus sp.]
MSASLPVRGEVSAGGALRAAALAAARGEAAPTVAEPAATPTPTAPLKQTATATSTATAVAPNVETATGSTDVPAAEPVADTATESVVVADAEQRADTTAASIPDRSDIRPQQWHQIVSELDVSGMPKQLASNCELVSAVSGHITLRLESVSEHLNTPRFRDRLESALSQWLDAPAQLEILLENAELNTPARIDEQKRSDEMAAARASIGRDPVVRQLIERVDGAVDESSIAPMSER